MAMRGNLRPGIQPDSEHRGYTVLYQQQPSNSSMYEAVSRCMRHFGRWQQLISFTHAIYQKASYIERLPNIHRAVTCTNFLQESERKMIFHSIKCRLLDGKTTKAAAPATNPTIAIPPVTSSVLETDGQHLRMISKFTSLGGATIQPTTEDPFQSKPVPCSSRLARSS